MPGKVIYGNDPDYQRWRDDVAAALGLTELPEWNNRWPQLYDDGYLREEAAELYRKDTGAA